MMRVNNVHISPVHTFSGRLFRSLRGAGSVSYAACAGTQPAVAPAAQAPVAAGPVAAAPVEPPPRTIADITALLSQYKPDPAKAAQMRAQAAAEPSANAGPRDLVEFFSRRAAARESLGLIAPMLEDRRKLVELTAGQGEAPSYRNQLAVAEQTAGNFQAAISIREEILKSAGSRPGASRAAAYQAARTYAAVGELGRARDLITQGDQIYSRSLLAGGPRAVAAWRPWTALFSALSESARGKVFEAEGKLGEAEAANRRSLAAWEEDLKLAGARSRDDPAATPIELVQAGLDFGELGLSQVLLRLGKVPEAELAVRNVLMRTLSRVGKYATSTAAAAASFAFVLNEQGRFREAEVMAKAALEILDTLGAPDGSWMRIGARRAIADSLVGREEWSAANEQYLALRRTAEADEYNRRVVRGTTESSLAAIKSGDAARALQVMKTRLDEYVKSIGPTHYQTGETRGVYAMALAVTGEKEAALREFRDALRVLLSPEAAASETQGLALRHLRLRQIIDGYMTLLWEIRGTDLEKKAGVDAAEESFRLADAARGGSVQQALAASAARSAANQPGLGELIRKEQDLRQEIASLYDFLLRMMGTPPEQQLPKVIADMRTRIGAIGKERTQLSAQIARQFPDYAALVNPRAATLAEARRAMRPGEALMSVLSTADRSFVWVLNPAGQVSFHSTTLGEREIHRIVDKLRTSVDPGDLVLERLPAFDFAGAYRLYSELFAPGEPIWSQAKTLIVTAAGSLGQIPLAILPTQAVSPVHAAGTALFSEYAAVPWLAKRVAIADVPTVTALVRLRSLPAGSAQRSPFAGFGDPQFSREASAVASAATRGVRLRSLKIERVSETNIAAVAAVAGVAGAAAGAATVAVASNTASAAAASPGWTAYSQISPLPDTREEILSIARALGADAQKDVYLGLDANKNKVMQTDLSKRRIVAFATHGLIPGDLPGLDQPALALAALEDGKESPLLTLDDVLGLKLDADWVVLSACNTAAGDGQGAEAVSGLGRGFFYAGTRALLVTHWPVETVSARKLVSGIFERYAKEPTLTRAQAVQGAMLAVMADRAENFSYAHPMFWAPYALIGDGGR